MNTILRHVSVLLLILLKGLKPWVKILAIINSPTYNRGFANIILRHASVSVLLLTLLKSSYNDLSTSQGCEDKVKTFQDNILTNYVWIVFLRTSAEKTNHSSLCDYSSVSCQDRNRPHVQSAQPFLASSATAQLTPAHACDLNN